MSIWRSSGPAVAYSQSNGSPCGPCRDPARRDRSRLESEQVVERSARQRKRELCRSTPLLVHEGDAVILDYRMRRRTNGTSRRRLIVVADLEEEVACQNTGTRGAREHLLTVDANREHISGKPERERVLSVQRGRAAKIRAPALSPNFFIKQG